MEVYQLLIVDHSHDEIVASLPHRQLIGPEDRERLAGDFQRLCESNASIIKLDLRVLEFIDGHFPGMLVALARNLAAAGSRLTVNVSPDIAEVLKITKLDQLVELE